jgi:hypothetical protein
MCDYSLMHFPNRLAVEGEQLLVHRFAGGSMGLASPVDLFPVANGERQRRSFWEAVKEFFNPSELSRVTAVCIPPSARLRLDNIETGFQREYHVGPEEEVTFVQLSADPHTYRDAVCFSSGCRVPLQELPEGLRVTVLNLAARDSELEPTEGDIEFTPRAV